MIFGIAGEGTVAGAAHDCDDNCDDIDDDSARYIDR
jgi:hypothetical protein